MGGPLNEMCQTSSAYTNPRHFRNTMRTPRKSLFPPVTKTFTADAVTMYPSIDTDKGMLTMERLFKEKHDLPYNYPTTAVLNFLIE